MNIPQSKGFWNAGMDLWPPWICSRNRDKIQNIPQKVYITPQPKKQHHQIKNNANAHHPHVNKTPCFQTKAFHLASKNRCSPLGLAPLSPHSAPSRCPPPPGCLFQDLIHPRFLDLPFSTELVAHLLRQSEQGDPRAGGRISSDWTYKTYSRTYINV